MTAPARQPRTRAFTLIELVVVIVILGIAAAAIAPRFVGGTARSAEVSALAVRDVISAVATRSVLTGRLVAVAYDSSRGIAEAQTWLTTGAPNDWTAPAQWAPDPLTPPAGLNEAKVTSVRADGLTLDPSHWRVEFDPGVRRPALSVWIAQTGGKRAWRIDLAAGAMRAEIGSSDRPENAATVIDLDAAGRAEEAW
jgi:prepilin-type N-terminal cleavage/methylation domain-containing protein